MPTAPILPAEAARLSTGDDDVTEWGGMVMFRSEESNAAAKRHKQNDLQDSEIFRATLTRYLPKMSG